MAGGPQAGGIATNPNINQLAAQGIKGAGINTALGMGFQPGQLATTNLDPYMNPYQQNVIDRSIADINRQGSQMQNTLGAQASAANAFGGSRHGIAEGELGRNILQSVADTTTGLNQQGFTQAQGAAQTDIANQMQGAQHRLGSAGQLANISNLGFGMGQTVSNNLAQQGALQQGTNQALIDAIKGQFGGYSGAGAEGLGWLSQALGATTVPQTQTDTKQAGLFDYLTLAAQASDERLKTNIKKMGQLKSGLNIYKWDWKEGAEKFGADMNHTIGVIAQEVMKVMPEAVVKNKDGYYRVYYSKLG